LATMDLLQAEPATAKIPVVLATSRDVPHALVRKAGFRGYLQKPVTFTAFIQHVRRWSGNSSQAEGSPSIDPVALLPPLS
jgi:CheY-like chemotaxis protein